MEPNVTLTIIIVNYKTKELTKNALTSLVAYCPWIKQQQVIIIDNASNDGSVEFLQSTLPWTTIIASEKNTGFSGGNNLGLKQATGEYILLLNSDTVTIEDPLSKIISYMETHKDVGIASIQLLNEDRSIQETGGYFPTLPRVFAWMFFLDDIPYVSNLFKSFHPDSRFYNKEKRFYTKERELDWLTGAFFLLRRNVYQAIGGFDEAMFMYAEEMEYCYRAKQKGFRCMFVPVAKIIHLGGKSSASIKNPLLGEYKNIVFFYKKHRTALEVFVVKQLLRFGAIMRIIVFPLVGRKAVGAVYREAFGII